MVLTKTTSDRIGQSKIETAANIFKQAQQTGNDAPHLQDKFWSIPHSTGIATLEVSLRNFVLLMLELNGTAYAAGYHLHHLSKEEHKFLALFGLLRGDPEIERKKREFLDRLVALEEAFAKSFLALLKKTRKEIRLIKEDAERYVKHAKRRFEAAEDWERRAPESERESAREEKKRAQESKAKAEGFKAKVEGHEARLDEVETIEDVEDVRRGVADDAADFSKEEKEPDPDPDPHYTRSRGEHSRDDSTYEESRATSDFSGSTSKGSDEGSEEGDTETGDESSEEEEKDVEDKPDPPAP